jgi:serine/threonine protein kinase
MSWGLFQRDPRQIGGYEVLAKIGKGTSGSVFKARHLETGTLVAIKVLSRAASRDAVSSQRFQQEIRASQALDDAHIVRGLEFGHEGTVPYLVMEFVDGVNLRSHLDRVGRMSEKDALRMATQIAQALQRAHAQGMIHRDVNPGNILLSADGRARLTDFGLVKSLESGLNLTATAMSLGTPCFMAPEQFHDAKRIDQRCDVYGLAATLYKALTGESPYNARAYGITVRKKLDGDVVPPRQLVTDLSMRVDWAIMRALSVSPMMRPESCAEFVRDLTGKDLLPLEKPAQQLDHRGRLDPNLAAQPEAERRGAIRYPCRFDNVYLTAVGKGQSSWNAEVRNISMSGLGLVLARRFERGTILALDWQHAMEEVRGSMMARVIRAQAQGSEGWLLGCQLAQSLEDDELRVLTRPPSSP